MTHRRTILSVAAQVWDQDSHSQADLDFLAAIARADKAWLDALDAVNPAAASDPELFNAVKFLATKQQEVDYAKALAALEACDEEAFAEAAE